MEPGNHPVLTAGQLAAKVCAAQGEAGAKGSICQLQRNVLLTKQVCRVQPSLRRYHPHHQADVSKQRCQHSPDSDTLYATKKAMYVTTSEFRYNIDDDNATKWGANYRTSIHRFDLSDVGAKYVASGQISGSVLNQFSKGEINDIFFVATTDGAPWWGNRDPSESKVTSLRTNRENRRLQRIGQVGNLGRDERIFAVRYRGSVAYVVTFRETDPLYIIDLSDPRNLKVTGELKIPGFSSYLHFVSRGRLLGVGQEVTTRGFTTGTKVSLFDVSNMTNPTELATWTLGGSYSNAEWDHRAFLYWQKLRIAVMPLNVYSGNRLFRGAIVQKVEDKNIREIGESSTSFPSTEGIIPAFCVTLLLESICGRCRARYCRSTS